MMISPYLRQDLRTLAEAMRQREPEHRRAVKAKARKEPRARQLLDKDRSNE